MDAEYQTNARQCGRRARRSIRGKGLTPYLNLAQGGLAGCLLNGAYLFPSADTHVRALRAGTGIFGRYGVRKFRSTALSMTKVILDNRRSDTLNTLQSWSGASAMSGHGRPPLCKPEPVSRARELCGAASSIPICWSPPLGRDSKTTGGKGGKGGNLESLGNGAFRRWREAAETGGNWRKPLQKLCSRNRSQFCRLHSIDLIGVPLAEIAEIPCKNLSRSQPHCASLFRGALRICRRCISNNRDDGSGEMKIVDVKAYPQLPGAQGTAGLARHRHHDQARLRHGEGDDRGRHHRLGREPSCPFRGQHRLI